MLMFEPLDRLRLAHLAFAISTQVHRLPQTPLNRWNPRCLAFFQTIALENLARLTFPTSGLS